MASDAFALRCPRCLVEVDPGNLAHRDADGNDAQAPSPPPIGAGRWARAIVRGDPDPLHSVDLLGQIDYDAAAVRAVCPEGHDLPHSLFDRPTIKVALVGLSSSGKSVYLGTLIEQLVFSARLHHAGLRARLEDQSRILFNERFGRFIDDNTAPLATTPDVAGITLQPLMAVLDTDSERATPQRAGVRRRRLAADQQGGRGEVSQGAVRRRRGLLLRAAVRVAEGDLARRGSSSRRASSRTPRPSRPCRTPSRCSARSGRTGRTSPWRW